MTTREEAAFILLAVFVVFCLMHAGVRKGLWSPLRLLLGPKLLIPFVVYVGWLVLLTVLVDHYGFWSTDLLAGTILWFLFTGFRHFLKVPDIGKEERFFRKSVIELIGVAALFEFFLNVRTFSLWVELVLQIALLIFGSMFAFSGSSVEFKQVRRLFGFLLGVLVIWQVTATILNLVDHWSDLDPHELISLFLLPVWLTIGTLPVIYFYGLFASYELLFVRMGFGVDDGKVSLLARMGVASELRGRLRRFEAVTRYGAWSAGRHRTFRGGRQAVRAALATEALREAEAAAAADRLVRYAGVAGVDDDGRQLDQREFNETRETLQWLATCQMGLV